MPHLLGTHSALRAATALIALAIALPALAQHDHQHGMNAGMRTGKAADPASSSQSFATLMDESMNTMNAGMARAPMNGDPDHDFASMMIPHHQGAVDMAKAELLHGKNPVLRRLAQEIIVTQGSEISVMHSELNKMPSASSPSHASHSSTHQD